MVRTIWARIMEILELATRNFQRLLLIQADLSDIEQDQKKIHKDIKELQKMREEILAAVSSLALGQAQIVGVLEAIRDELVQPQIESIRLVAGPVEEQPI